MLLYLKFYFSERINSLCVLLLKHLCTVCWRKLAVVSGRIFSWQRNLSFIFRKEKIHRLSLNSSCLWNFTFEWLYHLHEMYVMLCNFFKLIKKIRYKVLQTLKMYLPTYCHVKTFSFYFNTASKTRCNTAVFLLPMIKDITFLCYFSL